LKTTHVKHFQHKNTLQKQHSQRGAALLAVLIIALVLVILMSVASQSMQNKLDLAEGSKQHLQAKAAVKAKISELIYLLTTQRVTVAGISQGIASQPNAENENAILGIRPIGDEHRVDGFIIQQEDGLEFSIQNEAGLISINSSGQYWIKRWLQGYGYSVIEQANYADVLADYADPDNWRRPSGAELSSYSKELFATPTNFLLQSCSELWEVLNWSNLLAKHNEMLEQCSVRRDGSLHLNAMPIKLWQLLWPNSAIKIENERKQGRWLITNGDFLALEPSLLLIDDEYISAIGGSKYRLYVKKHNATKQLQIEIGVGSLLPFTIRQL
jgi:general secretion pathway protein K